MLEAYEIRAPQPPQEARDIARKAAQFIEAEKKLAQLYVYTNEYFRQATGEVARRTEAIENEQQWDWAAALAQESTKRYANDALQLYEAGKTQIIKEVQKPLPPPQPPQPQPKPVVQKSPPRPQPRQIEPARRPTLERKKLTWGERWRGETYILRD